MTALGIREYGRQPESSASVFVVRRLRYCGRAACLRDFCGQVSYAHRLLPDGRSSFISLQVEILPPCVIYCSAALHFCCLISLFYSKNLRFSRLYGSKCDIPQVAAARHLFLAVSRPLHTVSCKQHNWGLSDAPSTRSTTGQRRVQQSLARSRPIWEVELAAA